MAPVSEARLRALLRPFCVGADGGQELANDLVDKLGVYLELLLRWNARTNLTAVRDPETMVTRHFGESLFAGCCLRPYVSAGASLLDLGSGAGFPGIPIQLLLPDIQVTLAESQGKKVAFLREVVRVLGLASEVWAGRVETMTRERAFDVVTMRAVDRMAEMRELARARMRPTGVLLELTSKGEGQGLVYAVPGRRESVVRLSGPGLHD